MLQMLVLVFLLQAATGAFSQSPCSDESRATNMNTCLMAIRRKALDDTAFQFQRQPAEPFFGERTYQRRSLVEQIYGVNGPDLSSIDRYVAMTYTSPKGTYTACDNTYIYPHEVSFQVDPLSDQAYPSWDLREPSVTTWDFVEGDFFTVIRLDPDTSGTVQVVSNIQGNDWPRATNLFPYMSIKNPFAVVRPYATVIYKQSRRVPIQFIPSSGINVTDFAERNGLQGPVGLTWVQAMYDAYSADGVFTQNCASLVADAMRPQLPNMPWIPDPDHFSLSVFLRVKFNSPTFIDRCGPYFVTSSPVDFYLDSIRARSIDSADVRTGSEIEYTMEMSKFAPSPRDFFGKIHTLLVVNIETMFINSLIIDIHGGDVPSGKTLLSYFNTPDLFSDETEIEHHVFFLYEQQRDFSCNFDLEQHLSEECGTGNRCMRDIGEFVRDHRLQLVGLARMSVHQAHAADCARQSAM